MARLTPPTALIDAFGTLVTMDPPGPALRRELSARAGVAVSEEAADRAFRAEIRYYLDHHLEGRDPTSLESLRDRCASVLHAALAVDGVDLDTARAAMLAALRFRAYDDVRPALASLRARGVGVVVASNWDCSLPRALDQAGLGDAVDEVVSSAAVGAAKPDGDFFRAALEAAGCAPHEALFVGDSVDKDVEGARAAGIPAVLLVRAGERPVGAPPPSGTPTIATLAELTALI